MKAKGDQGWEANSNIRLVSSVNPRVMPLVADMWRTSSEYKVDIHTTELLIKNQGTQRLCMQIINHSRPLK